MSFLKEYTMLGELGSGGFAKVYKVRHNELGYIRAIRVLNETIIDENSKVYRKFLQECKVLLRLGNGSHRSIVHIYQPRLLENHALVEMDYVDGKDIAHYLIDNNNFVPVDEVVRMAQEISSALAYCHEDIYRFCMDKDVDNLQDDPVDGSKVLIDEPTRKRLVDKYKVIHNDIHSGNIMRRENGSFILLDFGLAITGIDDVRNSSRHDNGAVEFKSPEKWDDDAVLTEQSDVYSFGVVMYEYLAGRVPFKCDKSKSMLMAFNELRKAHVEDAPPSIFEFRKSFYEAKYPGRQYVKDYPDWLEEAILRCLEKNPQKRFRNGTELYEFISSHLKEMPFEKVNELKVENEQLRAKLVDLTLANDTLRSRRNDDDDKTQMQDRPNTPGEADLNSRISTLQNELSDRDTELSSLKRKIEAENYSNAKLRMELQEEKKRKKSAFPIVLSVLLALVAMALGAIILFGNDDKEAVRKEPEQEYKPIEDLNDINAELADDSIRMLNENIRDLNDSVAHLNSTVFSLNDSIAMYSVQLSALSSELTTSFAINDSLSKLLEDKRFKFKIKN